MEQSIKAQLAIAAPGSSAGLGSLGFLLDEDEKERRFSRYALIAALLLHLLIFAFNWPSFSNAVTEPDDEVEVMVFPITRIKVPPRRTREEDIKAPAKKIPIPDPDPQAPELIRKEEELGFDEYSVDDQLLPVAEIPEAPPVTNSPIKVGTEGLIAPRVLRRVPPIYPELARKIHYEGVVILELIISKTGQVESVTVLRKEPFGLTEAAVEAVRQWEFEASTLNGRPVRIRYELSVRFHLS